MRLWWLRNSVAGSIIICFWVVAMLNQHLGPSQSTTAFQATQSVLQGDGGSSRRTTTQDPESKVVDARPEVRIEDDSAVLPDLAEPFPVTFSENEVKNMTLLYVHVGKTGGETVKSVLQAGCTSMRNVRRRKSCLDRLPQSVLSKVVKGYYHCFLMEPGGIKQRANGYLVNLRHPVDRLYSWYNYVHPKFCTQDASSISPSCRAKQELQTNPQTKEFFHQCFPSIEPLIWPQSAQCKDLAERVLSGKFDGRRAWRVGAHMAANYVHYYRKSGLSDTNKPIFVVRTEMLWSDMSRIDTMLGGMGDFGDLMHSQITHGSEKNKVDTLPPEYASELCCQLQKELDIYRTLLMESVNLLAAEKASTWSNALQRCGWNHWLDGCSNEKNADIE